MNSMNAVNNAGNAVSPVIDQAYDYELELSRRDPARKLGRTPLRPDLVPLREAIAMDLLRRGAIDQPGQLPPVHIEPAWDDSEDGDEPDEPEDPVGPRPVLGVRARFFIDGNETSREWSIRYFRGEARNASQRYVDAGELKTGDLFDYRVFARPRAAPPRRFNSVPREAPLPIETASLSRLMREALLFGADDPADPPAFIEFKVLQETAALARRARPNETGGLLLGRLYRDPVVPELFLHVTEQVPVPAVGELTRLSFTPRVWAALREEAGRRGGDLTWLGWYHNHSFTHAEDAEDADGADGSEHAKGVETENRGRVGRGKARRKVATAFLSEDDLRVHRTVFPRGHTLALLITDSPDSGLAWDVFGWRDATVVPRSFHVLGAPVPDNVESREPRRSLS